MKSPKLEILEGWLGRSIDRKYSEGKTLQKAIQKASQFK